MAILLEIKTAMYCSRVNVATKEESDVDVALNLQAESQREVVMAISDYSSHDWRKHTDNAVVVDKNKAIFNECKVYFTDPKG